MRFIVILLVMAALSPAVAVAQSAGSSSSKKKLCEGYFCRGTELEEFRSKYDQEIEKHKATKAKLKQAETDLAKAKEITPVANIDRIQYETICAVLFELRYLDIESRNVCIGQNLLPTNGQYPKATQAIAAAIAEFQNTLGEGVPQDGWLRNDQFVQLLCRGAEYGQADSMRYLGWMFATGQGVQQDFPKARYLLERAYDRFDALVDAAERDGDDKQRKNYLAVRDNAGALLDKVQANMKKKKPWTQGSASICPRIDVVRSAAHQRADDLGNEYTYIFVENDRLPTGAATAVGFSGNADAGPDGTNPLKR